MICSPVLGETKRENCALENCGVAESRLAQGTAVSRKTGKLLNARLTSRKRCDSRRTCDGSQTNSSDPRRTDSLDPASVLLRRPVRQMSLATFLLSADRDGICFGGGPWEAIPPRRYHHVNLADESNACSESPSQSCLSRGEWARQAACRRPESRAGDQREGPFTGSGRSGAAAIGSRRVSPSP
jgi:hypothetical protein